MPAPKVKSKDNSQQKVRDDKQNWNHSYKLFSQKLKAFKDGLNGRGNAKAGLPPSNIKEPMPGEIGSFLSQLAGEFQTIVSGAEGIIAEQAQYARTRRRRKPKAPGQPTVAPTTAPSAQEAPTAPGQDNVVETLSRLGEYEIEIEKLASGRLSRFWQYLTSIFSTKEFEKQRIGLLSRSADLYYSLLDFENDILSSSISNIPKTIAQYKKFKYNFNIFVGVFRGVEAMIERKAAKNGVENPTKKDQSPKEEPEDQSEQQPEGGGEPAPQVMPDDLQKIKVDMHSLFNASLAKKQVIDLNNMFREYASESDPHTKTIIGERIKEYHKSLAQQLSNEVQKRYGPANIRGMQDIIDIVKKNRKAPAPDFSKMNKTEEYISDYMIKTSHNKLTRYLKKKLIKALPFNKTAPIRLELIDTLDDMKITIKQIMDNLEKDLSIEELKKFIEKLEEDRDRLKRPLHILNTVYMKKFFEQRQKHQKKQKGKPAIRDDEEMMDYVMQRKLKRELGEDLG
jgi:hypothetical protein